MNPLILENAFNRVDFDRDLVFKFFIMFSMFEYALKKVGFRRIGRTNGVEPDWDAFALEIRNQFTIENNHELAIAVEYMLRHPTKKQIVRGDTLTFIETQRPEGMSDTEWLSILIRRVRNNLFHGGKFRYDRHRDTFLIQFSIVILESWACCHHNVNLILNEIQ